VRVIAASKVDLKEWSDQQKFRSDLYYRLNLIILNLPPLRERREDIPLLFEHFLLGAAARYKREAPPVPGALMQALMAHNWPGNVRELRNIAERYVLGLGSGADGLLSARSMEAVPLADQVGAFERAVIEQELRKAGGSVSAVSVALGVPKQTLYYKMQKYGLASEDFKG